jgi:hypothetical protein
MYIHVLLIGSRVTPVEQRTNSMNRRTQTRDNEVDGPLFRFQAYQKIGVGVITGCCAQLLLTAQGTGGFLLVATFLEKGPWRQMSDCGTTIWQREPRFKNPQN